MARSATLMYTGKIKLCLWKGRSEIIRFTKIWKSSVRECPPPPPPPACLKVCIRLCESNFFDSFSFCQVLVVITDNKSGSTVEDVQTAAKPLEDAGIAVIPVAIGDDADVGELENLTPDKENVIQPPDGTTPDELAKMIMEKIHTGMIDLYRSCLLCYCFGSVNYFH